MGGPLSIGLPEPLNMRPSISSETGVFNTYRHEREVFGTIKYIKYHVNIGNFNSQSLMLNYKR